ncbi:hypothetical protein BHS30_28620 [Klebsiella pneumoniae]|nr:hypothetical protein BHS30_28620 [Klebsiella pneumoniae]
MRIVGSIGFREWRASVSQGNRGLVMRNGANAGLSSLSNGGAVGVMNLPQRQFPGAPAKSPDRGLPAAKPAPKIFQATQRGLEGAFAHRGVNRLSGMAGVSKPGQ